MDSEYISPMNSELFDFIVELVSTIFSAFFAGIAGLFTSLYHIISTILSGISFIASNTVYTAISVYVWLAKAILISSLRLACFAVPQFYHLTLVFFSCAAYPFINWPIIMSVILGIATIAYIITNSKARNIVRFWLFEPIHIYIYRTIDTLKEECLTACDSYQRERARKAAAAAATTAARATTRVTSTPPDPSPEIVIHPVWAVNQSAPQPQTPIEPLFPGSSFSSSSSSSSASRSDHIHDTEAYEWYTKTGRYASWARTYRPPSQQYPHARAPTDFTRMPPSCTPSPSSRSGASSILTPQQQCLLHSPEDVQWQLNELRAALGDPAEEASFLGRGMSELLGWGGSLARLAPSVRDAAIDHWRDQRIRMFLASDVEICQLQGPKRGMAKSWNDGVLRGGELEWLGNLKLGSPLREEVLMAVVMKYWERKVAVGNSFAASAPASAIVGGGILGTRTTPSSFAASAPAAIPTAQGLSTLQTSASQHALVPFQNITVAPQTTSAITTPASTAPAFQNVTAAPQSPFAPKTPTSTTPIAPPPSSLLPTTTLTADHQPIHSSSIPHPAASTTPAGPPASTTPAESLYRIVPSSSSSNPDPFSNPPTPPVRNRNIWAESAASVFGPPKSASLAPSPNGNAAGAGSSVLASAVASLPLSSSATAARGATAVAGAGAGVSAAPRAPASASSILAAGAGSILGTPPARPAPPADGSGAGAGAGAAGVTFSWSKPAAVPSGPSVFAK